MSDYYVHRPQVSMPLSLAERIPETKRLPPGPRSRTSALRQLPFSDAGGVLVVLQALRMAPVYCAATLRFKGEQSLGRAGEWNLKPYHP